jgi:DNA-binding transcriptional regulator YhcF (GntR family)
MELTIDPGSATPPFEQLRTQFIAQITAGELIAGAKLPTVRKLADELGLATNTVARAYRELEADGFVETHGRNGTHVNAQGDVAARHRPRPGDRARDLRAPQLLGRSGAASAQVVHEAAPVVHGTAQPVGTAAPRVDATCALRRLTPAFCVRPACLRLPKFPVDRARFG